MNIIMKTIKRIIWILTLCSLSMNNLFAQIGNLADDPNKEWCYLKKSTTVIGMPFHPQVTEVTYDGSLYTGYAELCFGYGKNDTPVLIRQKTFEEGWIPVVGDEWQEGTLKYGLKMFSAPLSPEDVSNCVNFVKYSVTNTGKGVEEAYLTVATRGKVDDYRLAKLNDFSASDLYEVKNNALYKNEKLIFSFADGYDKIEAVKGVSFSKPFTAASMKIAENTRSAIVYYKKRLKPGESAEVLFKMPCVPVVDTTMVNRILKADYDHYYQATVGFWKKLVAADTYFEIPEKRIQDAQRASMVHLLLATRTFPDGWKTQTDGIPYPNFFLTSGPQMSMAYLTNGCPDYAKMIVRNAIKQQESDGLYFDRSLAHGGIIPTAHGHIMYMTAAYYLITRDKELGEEVFPSLVRAIEYLNNETNKNKYGLLPPTYPYDNEMIDGHYACNNYWALLGLRFCIRMAKDLGHTEVLQKWEALEKKYTKSILDGIEYSVKEDGYVPTGLYEFITGKKARRGFNEYQCNSDWENMLLAYPTELLPAEHPYVKGSLKHIRKGYGEGIMTYRHGQHLHQYITANLIEQYMVQGEQRQTLVDFYHLILHSGSTHEGFENLVIPWKDRMVDPHCPTPHAWASAKTAFLIRNFLLYEYGGRAGMEQGRDLYLFPVISPEWAKEGDCITIHKAPTEMGQVSASIKFEKDRAKVTFSSKYTDKPQHVKIRIPYFKQLKSFKTDASQSYVKDGCIVLSPDFKKLLIEWEENQEAHRGTSEFLLESYRACDTFEGIDENGVQIIDKHKPFLSEDERKNEIEPLNFELVKKCFLKEFERRTSIHSKIN